MYPIITISREFGSGGHSIGQNVAEELGIPFYDSAIVEQVAQESGLDKDLIAEQGEQTTLTSRLFSGFTLGAGPSYENPQDQIYRLQAGVIRRVAEDGPCVIVGRCADYILQNAGHVTLNVFIHAPLNWRADYILNRYGETEVSIQKRLEKKDRSRRLYYNYYTDREWGDYRNYHLALDSAMLGRETCVQLILQAAERLNQRVF